MISSRLLYPEALAGLAAALRGRRIQAPLYPGLNTQLEELWQDIVAIEVTRAVAVAAADVAERQRLQGYDAVHLAAAMRAQLPPACGLDDCRRPAVAVSWRRNFDQLASAIERAGGGWPACASTAAT